MSLASSEWHWVTCDEHGCEARSEAVEGTVVDGINAARYDGWLCVGLHYCPKHRKQEGSEVPA